MVNEPFAIYGLNVKIQSVLTFCVSYLPFIHEKIRWNLTIPADFFCGHMKFISSSYILSVQSITTLSTNPEYLLVSLNALVVSIDFPSRTKQQDKSIKLQAERSLVSNTSLKFDHLQQAVHN